MTEEKKVAAAEELADTEGKASISEKLKAAEGNINRVTADAKARKSEQAKSQKRSESEAKARLEEAERRRLEDERAARLVAEQKLAAFEYAENYRKKLQRDKQRSISAAKQRAKEEREAEAARERKAREAEIAAVLENERREARERGKRATDLLSRVTKLAVVDGDGNLRIVDKDEAADIKRAESALTAPEKTVKEEIKAEPSPIVDSSDAGRILVTDDSLASPTATESYFDDGMVTEEDGKILLNITDNRMMIEVTDGDEEAEAREYEEYVAAYSRSAEAYGKEMKRMMDAYAKAAAPAAPAASPACKPDDSEKLRAKSGISEDEERYSKELDALRAHRAELAQIHARRRSALEEEISELAARVATAGEGEKIEAPIAAPVIDEPADEVLPEREIALAAAEESSEPVEEESPAEQEEPVAEAAAVVSVDEGIVAELRAVASRVTGIKSLKRYLARVNKAVKRISRELVRLDKKLEVPDVNEAPATVVEKLVILSDLLEIKSDSLAAAARICAKKFAKRLKAELTELIEAYNSTVATYAAMTGEQLTRVSGFLPKYISEGTGTAVIPKLTYSERYIEVNDEKKAAAASYVFVFPNINDIAEGGTLTATPEVTSEGGSEENSLAKRVLITSPYTNEELLDCVAVHTARELKRALKRVKKSYKKLDREILDIRKKRAEAIAEHDERESLKMMVEEITVVRQRVEISAAILGYCRDVKVKKFISAAKADMIEAMAEYNKSVDEYAAITGDRLTRASAYMADKVIEGNGAPRLARLAYYRELVETVGDVVKVIGRKNEKDTLPTTSCTFIFGTTPVVTAGPIGVPAVPAMPSIQAQLVPPTDGGEKPSFMLSAAPVVAPTPVGEPTHFAAPDEITLPESLAGAFDSAPAPADEAVGGVVVAEPPAYEFDDGEIAAMDRRMLKSFVVRKDKEIAALEKELDTHDKAKRRAAGAERSSLLIACLEDLRCIIGTRCEVLEACVHVQAEKEIDTSRALLISDITKYNEYVSEYNLTAREQIPTATTEMVDRILNGEPYKKLPRIVQRVGGTTDGVDTSSFTEYIRANTAEIKKKQNECKKLRDRAKRVKGDGAKASYLVQCVNIRVGTVNMLVEQLERCVLVKNAKYRKQTVKALSLEIEAYNKLAEDYTALTGRAVVKADTKMPKAIVNGKPYARLLAVSGAGAAAERLTDTAAMGRSFADSVRLSLERTEVEAKCEEQKKKSTAALADEFDFFIDKLYTKRKDLSFNFDGVKMSARSRISKITKKMAALERREAKALKKEEADNARYYEAVLTDVSTFKLKKESDRAELSEVQHRIAELLNERDAKNSELINHYAGTDRESLKEQKRKHRELRFKAERRAFNSLRRVDKDIRGRYENGQIDSYKPERIHAAMYEMIEAKGEIAVCKARLRQSKKVKLTKHQREIVKKDCRNWESKYKSAEARLKNNLKVDVFKRMIPFGILLLVILAAAVALVALWPSITAWLATLGLGI